MLVYTLRRLSVAVLLAWGVLTLVFLLTEALPGDPFVQLSGPGTSPEASERLRALHGTEQPLSRRYLRWLTALAQGDLGHSLARRLPVTELIGRRLQNSLALASVALLAQFALGTSAGLAAARWGRRRVGKLIETLASLLYTVPSYCLAIFLIGLFAVGLGWLPTSQMESIDAVRMGWWPWFADRLRHLVLPTLALALPVAGGIALYVRDRVQVALEGPFVLAARARGLRESSVLLRHALGNSLVPLVQLVGLSLPGLVGGGIVVEVLFAWPGMGRLVYEAVLARDLPVVLGCTLIGSLLVIVGSLVADLLAALADPRLRETVR